MNFDTQHTQVTINSEVHATFADALYRYAPSLLVLAWLSWEKLYISKWIWCMHTRTHTAVDDYRCICCR